MEMENFEYSFRMLKTLEAIVKLNIFFRGLGAGIDPIKKI